MRNVLHASYRKIAEDVSSAEKLSARDLYVRLLIHLPRLAEIDGYVGEDAVVAEALRIARQERSTPRNPRNESASEVSIGRSHLVRLDDHGARDIFERRHFLRSWRPDATYYALAEARSCHILAACGIGRFRWSSVRRELCRTMRIPDEAVMDLCRMFAFEDAPVNSISRMLSLVSVEIKRDVPGCRVLVTVVDPNLGFDGVSYRASNWKLVARVPRPPYAYVDGNYRTAGQLIERYGTMDAVELRTLLGERYSRSCVTLEPSMIYARALDKDVANVVERMAAEPKMIDQV